MVHDVALDGDDVACVLDFYEQLLKPGGTAIIFLDSGNLEIWKRAVSATSELYLDEDLHVKLCELVVVKSLCLTGRIAGCLCGQAAEQPEAA